METTSSPRREAQTPTLEAQLQMFERMLLLRVFDDKVSERCTRGEIQGLIHLGIGEEAVAVGACAALEDGDKVVSTHRAHGHFLARGADPNAFMAELYGKDTGSCRGKGGSMHLADLERGFLGANGVVGAGLPLAVGAALGAQVLGGDWVTLCFFGDGANNTGAFHESLNLASVWQLPVVFLCENNGYGISQSIDKQQRVAHVADRAPAYGLHAEIVDGNDILAVHAAVYEAAHKARRNGGPTLIECKTYRMAGHYEGDTQSYRDAAEVAAWRERDPIARFETVLRARGCLDDGQRDAIEARTASVVEAALAFARGAPAPNAALALAHVYAGEQG